MDEGSNYGWKWNWADGPFSRGTPARFFNSDPRSLWPQVIGKTEQKYAKSEPASADPWTRTVHLSTRFESSYSK